MSPKKKILVVDDEPHIVSILEGMLTQRGYAVRTATDGRQALSLASQDQPDLIILDLLMPVLDGWRACQRFKSGKTSSRIPIIILSGLMSELDDTTKQEMGDAYLSKPFEIDALVDTIRSLLKEDK
jgi:two-component system alkaline phosphatase synthesis response regulator PhoP